MLPGGRGAALQSLFLATGPIFVWMLRSRKKVRVEAPQTTSATQKAVSQPWCLAMVLNGSPARKPPTGEKTFQKKLSGANVLAALMTCVRTERVLSLLARSETMA